MRNVEFANQEYYHVFNHGVESRNIYIDQYDVKRFLKDMNSFNTVDPIGSIYITELQKNIVNTQCTDPLVDIICYCLNQNHYHLLLRQCVDGGISEFMKRLGGGYTRYYNEKYDRSGVLFQGAFKAVHINSNEQLMHVSCYVNLNNRIHKLSDWTTQSISSWDEYTQRNTPHFPCVKENILGLFDSKTAYKEFALQTMKGIIERKVLSKAMSLEKY